VLTGRAICRRNRDGGVGYFMPYQLPAANSACTESGGGNSVVSRRGQAGYSDSLKLWRSLESWQNEGFNLDHGS
jgi:hypothetical protein